ncbi:hypothetical protein B0H19DRAFT_1376237 [Mycena capillaripes]|nr:hypothetical protein B0H19DRAFT_1376237 [Mycena capillaripes]
MGTGILPNTNNEVIHRETRNSQRRSAREQKARETEEAKDEAAELKARIAALQEARRGSAAQSKELSQQLKTLKASSGSRSSEAAGLFARENSAAINAASQQRLLDTNTKSSVAVYQNTLKQQWDSLSGESQAAWNDRAEAEAGNVLSKCLLSLAADTLTISFRNQQEFIETMSMALQDLCQGGLLGDSEMILWYAFREVGNDDLRAGSIHAHSAHNQVRIGAGQEDLHSQYEKAWWHFADDSIPRNVPVNTSIPRNSADQPVFPAVDLNTVSMADMRTLLGDYFDQCWDHRGVDNKATLIPWEKLVSEPGKCCYFQNLSAIEVLTLAQCLLSTSSINSPTPFRFLDPEEELLVHSNPASPPESPPRQSLPPGSPPKSSASPAHNLQKSLSPPPPTIVEQAPKSPAFRRETRVVEQAGSNIDGGLAKKRRKIDNPAPVPNPTRKSERHKSAVSKKRSGGVAKRAKTTKWRGWVEVDSDVNELS